MGAKWYQCNLPVQLVHQKVLSLCLSLSLCLCVSLSLFLSLPRASKIWPLIFLQPKFIALPHIYICSPHSLSLFFSYISLCSSILWPSTSEHIKVTICRFPSQNALCNLLHLFRLRLFSDNPVSRNVDRMGTACECELYREMWNVWNCSGRKKVSARRMSLRVSLRVRDKETEKTERRTSFSDPTNMTMTQICEPKVCLWPAERSCCAPYTAKRIVNGILSCVIPPPTTSSTSSTTAASTTEETP